MTSMVVPPDEGAEMVRQLAIYDGLTAGDYFARLTFTLDVSKCDCETANALVDELNGVDDSVDVGVVGGLVDFDYYVTADLRPALRAIASRYAEKHGAELIFWATGER